MFLMHPIIMIAFIILLLIQEYRIANLTVRINNLNKKSKYYKESLDEMLISINVLGEITHALDTKITQLEDDFK